METQFRIAEVMALSHEPRTTQFAPGFLGEFQSAPTSSEVPQGQQSQIYVTLHGHFYQPPRENPWLGIIEQQPSALPFQNWNERICHECYRPNAYARILNEAGDVLEIVNNFEYLSFNIGPTLMAWLEQYDPEVYQRILEADHLSCERLSGHGNAMAQVYNHTILPLANQQDKITQIRWGKADFEARFGRATEGMWLAEAAVDAATLEVLVAEGIKFIIVAPSQVQRCRPLAPAADPNGMDYPWQDVGGGQIDPTRPYRCFLPGGDRQRDYIDIFIYDGPISRDIGFDDEILSSSQQLVERLGQAVRRDRSDAQLIAIATDGETFGHHKRSTEKSLAYGFRNVLPRQGWTVTNFAHFLSLHPPQWEVELKPVTAWSCAHGVDRWQEDCGCGGGGSWHQRWRRPLRDALDWLSEQLAQVFTEWGSRLFKDPWAARNDYIEVLLAQGKGSKAAVTSAFLTRHQTHSLSVTEQVDALRLLEMQRNGLLMYTSCGWFFEELSRPEGVQILRYAAQAISLAGEVAGTDLEPEFIERLALAPSNIEQFQTGEHVYRQLVMPARVTQAQIIAHYAMSLLFHGHPAVQQHYDYAIQQQDCEIHQVGHLTLATGHLHLTADFTGEVSQVIFAVLHMGSRDFHCVIQPFTGRPHYTALKQVLLEQLQQASIPRLVLVMNQSFGTQSFGLQDLFVEARHQILRLLSQSTLMRLAQTYTQIYREHYNLLAAHCQDGLEIPQELLAAAQVALSHRAAQIVHTLLMPIESNTPIVHYQAQIIELKAIATEAERLGCNLDFKESAMPFNRLLRSWLWQALHHQDLKLLQNFSHLLKLARRLHLNLQEDRLQELYLDFMQRLYFPQCSLPVSTTMPSDTDIFAAFLTVGALLTIDMGPWLAVQQYGVV
jgi:alpha-amylase/alpha-mannosidase (GH57 family)